MADNELMLTKGLKACIWTPKERQTTPFANAGGIVVMQGFPYWHLRCEYENLEDSDWVALRAWLSRRRGAFSPFKAFRAMNRTPIGGASSCTVSAGGGGTITATASPALQVGDMVAYDVTAGGRAVVELTAANGGNNFDCFPPAPAGSANPECVDAGGYFRIIPASVSMSEPYDPKKSLRFEARQDEPSYA